MHQDSSHRATIDPYYKPHNVFEREDAYYNQVLTGTRSRSNLRGSHRQSSLQRSGYNERGASISPPHNQNQYIGEASNVNSDFARGGYQSRGDYSRGGSTNEAYLQAYDTNSALRQELEGLVSGTSAFGNSENVVKLSHYNFNHSDMTKIKEQEAQIARLEMQIKSNEEKIRNHRKAGEELAHRMANIQSIDKEIYRTLQSSVNRDRDLLDRASSALARGQRREDIARLLQQILS